MSEERPEPIAPELAALLDDERSARPPHGALARVWSQTALTIGVGGVPYGGSGGSGGSGGPGGSGSVGSAGGVGSPGGSGGVVSSGSSGGVGAVSGSGGLGGGAVAVVAGKASSLVVALLTTTIALGGAGGVLYQRSHSSQSRVVEVSAQRAMVERSAGASSPIAPSPTAPSPGSPADTPWEVVPTPNDPAAPDLAAPGLAAPLGGPAVPVHASATPRPAASSLSEERATLERARDALAHEDGAQALRWTDAHTRRFASGQLAEEREALAIQALVLVHRYDEARARAAHFKSTWPESLFLPTVAASLDSIP